MNERQPKSEQEKETQRLVADNDVEIVVKSSDDSANLPGLEHLNSYMLVSPRRKILRCFLLCLLIFATVGVVCSEIALDWLESDENFVWFVQELNKIQQTENRETNRYIELTMSGTKAWNDWHRLEASKRLYLLALKEAEKLGRYSNYKSNALINLSKIAGNSGNWDEAEKYAKECVAHQLAFRGPRDDLLMYCYKYLAVVAKEKKQEERSLYFLKKAARIAFVAGYDGPDEGWGDDALVTWSWHRPWDKLTEMLLHGPATRFGFRFFRCPSPAGILAYDADCIDRFYNRPVDAEETYRRALASFDYPDSLELTTVYKNYADYLHKQGRLTEARWYDGRFRNYHPVGGKIPTMKELKDGWLLSLAKARVMNSYACFLRSRGRIKEAENFDKEVDKIRAAQKKPAWLDESVQLDEPVPRN